MSEEGQVKLQYSEVHRNLADPVYKINKLGLRLTTTDILVCGVLWFITYLLCRVIGGRLQSPDAFQWGPLVALITGLTAGYALSIMHRLRPELSLEKVITSGGGAEFSPYLSAALTDRKWSRQAWKD